MVFAAVLAGGSGSRMGNKEKPKQYLELAGTPILIHTLEKFYIHYQLEKILVLCPKEWLEYTKDLVCRYIGETDRVAVCEGGSSRNDTIMNAIRWLESRYELSEEDLIITHDSVRPFVTHRIIEENIKYATKYGACDTVIPATDTIVESEDRQNISAIPKRSRMYQGQTPQTFQIKKLKRLYDTLSESEKEFLTDAAKIFVMKGENVCLAEGEVSNIKITYPYDLRVAESLIRSRRSEE